MDPKDIRKEQVFCALRIAWRDHPHLRFMQLVSSIIDRGEDGYYLEDDEVAARLLSLNPARPKEER